MKTIKEFEDYLARARVEANDLKVEDLPDSIKCPTCEGSKAELTIDPFIYNRVQDAEYAGFQYSYHCKSCNEYYTTTKSDALSIATLERIN